MQQPGNNEKQPTEREKAGSFFPCCWLFALLLLLAACAGNTRSEAPSTESLNPLFEDNSQPWDSPIGQEGIFSGGLFARKSQLNVTYIAQSMGELHPCET